MQHGTNPAQPQRGGCGSPLTCRYRNKKLEHLERKKYIYIVIRAHPADRADPTLCAEQHGLDAGSRQRCWPGSTACAKHYGKIQPARTGWQRASRMAGRCCTPSSSSSPEDAGMPSAASCSHLGLLPSTVLFASPSTQRMGIWHVQAI